MKFVSTRGQSEALSFLDAVATGLAPDGGLYLPEKLPSIKEYLADWESLSYADLCYEFFRLFASDMDSSILRSCVQRAYESFRHPEIAPLVKLRDDLYVLELFHGPTLAFKDFALQLLGNLYEAQIERTGVPLNILGATSGDTGAAAIHGLLGKKGVSIFILYPDGGVSPLQERQMICTESESVHSIAIQGSFDDAQTAIKEVFGDLDFRAEFRLSAVNSINLARILAQCVYYIWAYFRLPAEARKNIVFNVPTGNFGNILAGWMTQRMGLPVEGFQVATNQNDILYRLFTTGEYKVGDVNPSLAPSMDIQISSNFERFLYYHEKESSSVVRGLMERFKSLGEIKFDHFNKDTFSASKANDSSIEKLIKSVKAEFDYTVDPHTACGFSDLSHEGTKVVLATAHPAKFPDVIKRTINENPKAEALEELKEKVPQKYTLDASAENIKSFIRKYGLKHT